MATVGYARVSTTGQSLDTQLEALSGCEKIFREKVSGAKDDRPELLAMLEFVREGDTVQVQVLDGIVKDEVTVSFDEGVLHIVLPKEPAETNKTVFDIQ